MKPTFYESYVNWMFRVLSKDVPGLKIETIKHIMDRVEYFANKAQEAQDSIDLPENASREDYNILRRMEVERVLAEAEKEPHISPLLEAEKTKDKIAFSPFLSASYQWKKGGMKTFYLSPGITAMLEATDLAGPSMYAKFPYKSFYIQFAANQHYSGEIPINGVFINIHKYKNEDQPFARMVFVGDKGLYHHTTVPMGTIEANPELDISETLMATAEQVEEMSKREEAKLFYKEIVSLVFKFLLYINSETPDLSPAHVDGQELRAQIARSGKPKKIRKLEAQLELISGIEHIDVGRSIKIDKKMPKDKTELGGTSFKYSYRFTVRGHFRNQACGEGRKEHKLIWIKPFFKGPDMSKVIHRPYKVD